METKLVYFDTTYLVRLYLPDPGFNVIRHKAADFPRVASAWHGQAEVIAGLHRAYREARIGHEELCDILDQFSDDSAKGMFYWVALNHSVRDRLEDVFRSAPPTSFLRAADALHLACAAEHGFEEVYSNDRHFLLAAPLFGLRGINLID